MWTMFKNKSQYLLDYGNDQSSFSNQINENNHIVFTNPNVEVDFSQHNSLYNNQNMPANKGYQIYIEGLFDLTYVQFGPTPR